MSDTGKAIFQYGGGVGEDFLERVSLSAQLLSLQFERRVRLFYSDDGTKKGSPVRAPGGTCLEGGTGFRS